MPFVGKNNLTAKERLYGEAIINQTRREREKAQQEAEEKARRWASLQMDNADKGPMPSPRERISLGGQNLTSGTVQTAADAIQRMRQQMLEQEQQRKEAERLRELYQPKTDRTAKDLAGMRLDAGDFAKVGGQALTSGTVQSAAKSLGSYKQSKQPSGPVKVDFMGVSSERDARLELLNENLRKLEEQRKRQEAKAAPNQEERQSQQEAFWRDRALSTGYSPNSSVQMSTRQQEAAEKAGALKNQERELGQYIKYLEGQGVQDRAQNAVTERDVQRGLNSTIEKGDITTGNEKVRSLARAIQYGKLGLEPHGFNETDISANMKWADALTERQKDTILAFAGREDWDGAQRYLNSISDQLNQKVAESEYYDLGTAGKALYWAPAGIDQFASGIAQLGNSEARNQTVTNRVSQMVQQDAYDTHPALGFAYDMGTSISNMTPSILLSAVAGPALGAAGLSASTAGAVAGGIGSAALGASAGGNAYAEKRRQGYSEDEAAAYATMVGASEAGLQYVLGGISKLGATPLAKATEMVSKIDNAFGQAALRLGANMLSEGVEEGLQSVLEPAFATLILDEKYQVSPQEVVTSFLMGALTAGLLEGMGAVRAGRAGQEVARNGGFDATAVDGYVGESGVDYFRGVSNAEETSQALDILDDYYGLSRGQNEDVRADVERQYAMRSAWYEGRDQARRATEQTDTEETQQDNVGQEWTQVDTNGQNGTPDTQAAEPEGLRLGAMWEDAKSQAAQETPQETAGADQTARLVQEARETVQAARAAQEDQSGEPEGLRLGAMWEDAKNQEGQFQRVQPVNTAQPEGLTLGAMWADNEASDPKNLNEGAGVNGREEDAAPAAGAETTAGRGLLVGGPGRVYGQGPGQQAGVVEEGPAGAPQASEQSRTASARNDLAKDLRGQEVSSRQLGLSRGTDTASVLVMPQELWDTEMVQVAQEVQARTGATVTYVLGNMKVSQTDGSVGTVRGVQMPGKILVQANHAKLSVGQIAKHEEFHVYAGRDPAMVREAEARIKAKYDEAEFNNVVATYIQKLQGVIDIPANGTVEQINEAFYRIMEEIYADAYAGINAFGVQASQYQETIQELIQERESAAPSLENAQATERTTGPTDTAKENGAGVRDGGLEEAESAKQTSEEEVKKQEVYRQAKGMRDALRDAYAEGRISEAEYDAAMDVVLERVDVDGGSMLEMFDRWDREDGLERYSKEDQETLDEFAIGDDGNIYLPGQPMPEAVRRMRNQAQSMSEQANGPEKFSVEDEKNDDRELKEDASGRMLSKEQRMFFEESMARVEEDGKYRYGYGRIVPVYHVTDSDFTVFDKGKLGENTDANASDELMAATAHVGFWFNTQNLVGSFGSKSGEYYLDIKNMYQGGSLEELCRDINEFAEDGTPKERGESFAEWLKDEGYDGVVINDEEVGGISFIALDPNQIKRTDNRTPTRGDDVRFSVEDEDILMEAEIGDDGNIYLPGGPVPEAVKRRRAAEQGANTTEQSKSVVEQGGASAEENLGTEAQVKKKKTTGKKPLKGTKPVAQSKAIIAKKDLRQTMMSLFSIPDGKKQMAGEIIERYADKMIRDGELTYEDRNALFNRLYEEGVVTVEADDLYREGRRAVAKGRVYVNEKVKGEFSDDWNDFRRRAFAAGVYLTNNPSDATPDSWNVELSQSFPGLFDPGELSERTILERIVEVAEEGKAEKMTLAEYTASMVGQEFKSLDDAMEGIERQMDWALRTFAEKANLELYLRDRTGKKIQQEREASAEARREQVIRNQAARAKERETRRKILERQRERREMSELQQKTLKQLQWLSKNRYRAPNELKKQFDEVLGDIDVLAAHAANEMNWSKKYQATWKDLRQMYLTAQKEDPNFLPSPELERIVNRLDGDKLADMDVEALGDLYRAAVGLRTEFYNRNNVLGSQKGELFSEVYRDAVDEITGSPKKLPGERGTVAEAADTFFNSELLTPMNVLHRMAGWAPEGAWHDMAAQLERGERDVRRYYVKANRMLEDFLKENEAWVKTADGQGKDGVWCELEVPQLLELNMGDKPIFGDTVKVYMTPAQKVHLYLESKSPENLRHIAMGGRTFADREIYAKGKRKEAFAAGKTIRLAPESVKKIVSDMTEQEMALANILEHYYNDFAKEEMNRVSNVLIGYDKAVSQNYAPIYTNENYSKSEIGVYESKAETVSRSKSRQEYASNATYNMSAFEAFERHVDDISRYVGMAIPARNWQTLMNWQVKDGSMKDSISHQWGQEGVDYINELLTDLQTSRRPDSSKVGKFWDKVVSKYISSIFGLNPSIVLKQLGSIPLAMPYLGVSNMPGPVKVAKIDRELIRTYTQDLDYRLLGYSMPETKILKENPGKLQTNKLLNFTFGGGAITATDGWAASVLWPWAENKVRKEQPDLMVGTQEMIESGQSPFYKAVAEEFEQAVSRSQSTTETLFSSRMRRSKHPVSRALTLFKTDAAQGYNTIRQVVGEAQYYARKGDKRMANRQKLRLGQAVIGLLAGYLWLEGINLIMELWKRQGDKYKDEEGNLQAESMAEDLVMGVVTNLFGLVPVAGEAAEFIASKMTGDKWYGMEVMGVEQFNEWLQYLGDAAGGIQETMVGAVDIVSNGGNLPKYLSDSSGKILSWIRDAAKATGQAFGIPVSNLETYSLGLMKWVSPAIATEYENMLGRGTKGNLKGLHGESLVARTQYILERRAGEVSIETAELLAELYEAGMANAIPAEPTYKLKTDTGEREMTAAERQLYDTAWSEVGKDLEEMVQSQEFQDLDRAGKTSALKTLYDYAKAKADEAVNPEHEVEAWEEAVDTILREGGTIGEWAALKAETKDMSSADKYRAIAASDMGEDAKVAAIGSVMGMEMETASGNPSQYAKMLDILDNGATLTEYLDLLEHGEDAAFLDQIKAGADISASMYLRVVKAIEAVDDNGRISQAEAEEGLRRISGLTNEERAELWQLQNKRWDPEKNPFDVEAGRRILAMVNK